MQCKIEIEYYEQLEKEEIERITQIDQNIDCVKLIILNEDNGLKLKFYIKSYDLVMLLKEKYLKFNSEPIDLLIDVNNDIFNFRSSVNGGEYGCYNSASTYFPKFEINTCGAKVIYDCIFNEINNHYPVDKLIENEYKYQMKNNNIKKRWYKKQNS